MNITELKQEIIRLKEATQALLNDGSYEPDIYTTGYLDSEIDTYNHILNLINKGV